MNEPEKLIRLKKIDKAKYDDFGEEFFKKQIAWMKGRKNNIIG